MSAIRPKRGRERGGFENRDLSGREAPLGLQDRHDHADDEQVVGVSEKAHPRDEHDLVLKARDLAVVERGEVWGSADGSEGHALSMSRFHGFFWSIEMNSG